MRRARRINATLTPRRRRRGSSEAAPAFRGRRGRAMTASQADKEVPAGASEEWRWNPDLPIAVSPVFAWPPRPRDAAAWLAQSWLSVSSTLALLALAVIVSRFAQPSGATFETLSLDWVLAIWARNLVLIFLVAGGLHLWLYRVRGQGDHTEYDRRDFAKDNGRFSFRNQVIDNMFWSIGSGVTFWTAYEVLYFWAAANSLTPTLAFSDSLVWSLAFLIIIPIWSSFHFYWVHRALHWPPLYQMAHNLHHRNINVGPWTGISMHPVEHLLYFSSILIHFIVPSSPLHVIFHLYVLALNPAVSHAGFGELLLPKKSKMALGDFFHQLHHRYFECNYGTAEVPWDVFFGSFHNGTPEATRRIRDRKKRLGR